MGMSGSTVQRTDVPLEPLRLMLDIAHEQTNARVRLSAAIVAAVAGAWLAWVDTSTWLRVAALLSLLFAVRFIASYRKVRRLAENSSANYLEITTERVTLTEGLGAGEKPEQKSIPFERVTRIELDEDRIAVVLHAADEQLVVEPVYGGLALRELAETLHRYQQAKR